MIPSATDSAASSSGTHVAAASSSRDVEMRPAAPFHGRLGCAVFRKKPAVVRPREEVDTISQLAKGLENTKVDSLGEPAQKRQKFKQISEVVEEIQKLEILQDTQKNKFHFMTTGYESAQKWKTSLIGNHILAGKIGHISISPEDLDCAAPNEAIFAHNFRNLIDQFPLEEKKAIHSLFTHFGCAQEEEIDCCRKYAIVAKWIEMYSRWSNEKGLILSKKIEFLGQNYLNTLQQ